MTVLLLYCTFGPRQGAPEIICVRSVHEGLEADLLRPAMVCNLSMSYDKRPLHVITAKCVEGAGCSFHMS